MPKYYRAQIKVEQIFEVPIVAKDETEAKRKAKDAAWNQKPALSSKVSSIDLSLEGECDYDVGTKVKHFIFGVGRIVELTRTTDANNSFGHRATIEFENGKTHDIHIPLTRDKLEILNE
jgi:hypothetical protein